MFPFFLSVHRQLRQIIASAVFPQQPNCIGAALPAVPHHRKHLGRFFLYPQYLLRIWCMTALPLEAAAR
ncbi:hypothetical protein D3C87_2043930 [compost metagenome]